MKQTDGQKAKNRLEEIKYLFKVKKITLEEAKALAETPLQIMNESMEKISKRFGQKHRRVTFQRFMR